MTMDQNLAQPGQPVKKQPSIIGIIIGVVMLVAGPIIMTIAIVSFVTGVTSTPTYMSDSIPVEVDLKANEEMGIWIEQSGLGYCQVLDPIMLPVPIDTVSPGVQTVNDYSLAATFTPYEDGIYTVMCSGDLLPFSFKVAPANTAGSFAIGLVVGILLLFAGIVVLILTLVRRSAWKRKNQQSPFAYAPQPPQPAYGQPLPQPVQPGYGMPTPPPAQPGYGTPSPPPAQPGHGTPASQSPQQGYATTPSQPAQPGYGPTPSQPDSPTPPQSPSQSWPTPFDTPPPQAPSFIPPQPPVQ